MLNVTKRTDGKKGTRIDTFWEQEKKGQTKKKVGRGNYKDGRDAMVRTRWERMSEAYAQRWACDDLQ